MKLSVIVCTRNRAHALLDCLDSISHSLSLAAPIEAEIVVVDNGSEDNTSFIVQKWASSSAFTVQLLHEPRMGLAIARNCALRYAKGEVLAWTDDDCRLSENYVRDLLRYFSTDTDHVLRGGRVELGDPTDLPMTTKTDPDRKCWHINLQSAKRVDLANTVYGCNMVFNKSLVERVGFFDERFGAGSYLLAAEDTDYIYRAYLAGVMIEYVPDMAVVHFHGRKTCAEGHKLFRSYMISKGGLYAKYILEDSGLYRQIFRDTKAALREAITGKNNFMPHINFSHKKVLACYIIGMGKYLFQSLKSRG